MCLYIVFFKQKTAYEMRISDWSSDVCSSDLKLLDFGIARIIEEGIAGKGTDGSGGQPEECKPGVAAGPRPLSTQALTEHGDRLLTPLYAAPEQILGHPATPAVAIYASGVLLNALLHEIGRASCRDSVCQAG